MKRSLVSALPIALLAGCASVLGADFDRPAAREDAGASLDGAAADGAGSLGTADGGGCTLACASPPPNACTDGKTLRAYVQRGSCAGGACTYPRYDVLCTTSCQNGACTGNEPCNGELRTK